MFVLYMYMSMAYKTNSAINNIFLFWIGNFKLGRWLKILTNYIQFLYFCGLCYLYYRPMICIATVSWFFSSRKWTDPWQCIEPILNFLVTCNIKTKKKQTKILFWHLINKFYFVLKLLFFRVNWYLNNTI